MTEHDLSTLAKAGDRVAANELLRRAEPHLRRLAARLSSRRRTAYPVEDEVLSEAMEKAWRAIPTWDPARGSLAKYVAPGMRAVAKRAALRLGHAVEIPDYAGGEDAGRYAEDRARAMRTRSADAQLGADPDAPALVDTLPARTADPVTALDAERVLRLLDPRAATVLRCRANGDQYPEIAAELGCKKQNVERIECHALDAARRRLGLRAVPEGMSPEGAVLFLLDAGPVRGRDIYHALQGMAPRKDIEDALLWLREQGFIVITERAGVHVTYALPARAAA